MKKKISIPIVIGLTLLAFVAGSQFSTLISGDNIYEQLNKFKDILSITSKYYVDDVDTQKLTDAAITGLIETLDPHSVYIKTEQAKTVKESFEGKFEGIGVEFSILNDTITVVSPISGGPSAMLGILSNDKIVTIEGKSAIKFTNEQVMKSLRGPKGTKVSVGIRRSGVSELLNFDIIRDVIPLYTVDASLMLENNVGYISVNRFAQETYNELMDALTKLKSQGMKKLVLDLRGNPGGYLDQAVKMTDVFLDGEGKKKIVYTKGRIPQFDEEYFATTGSEYEKTPIIVLISNGSASASEIVSGAIQDWDRGLVVGETSFGKGLVQRQFELADKSALRLTIARYYTPSGRLIQRAYNGDKEKYQKEAFEREEVEGENISHTEEQDTTRPEFKTSAGRKIYGGGGITPDYIVKPSALSSLTTELFRKNLYYQFIANYLDKNSKEIKSNYKNLQEFKKMYEVKENLLSEFIDFVKQKKIEVKDEDVKKDKKFLQARLKAYIARNFWGNEGWYSIVLTQDNQLEKALSIFPEAEKIAKLN